MARCSNWAAVALNPKAWVGQCQAGTKCVHPVSCHAIVAGTLDGTTGTQARLIEGRAGHAITGHPKHGQACSQAGRSGWNGRHAGQADRGTGWSCHHRAPETWSSLFAGGAIMPLQTSRSGSSRQWTGWSWPCHRRHPGWAQKHVTRRAGRAIAGTQVR